MGTNLIPPSGSSWPSPGWSSDGKTRAISVFAQPPAPKLARPPSIINPAPAGDLGISPSSAALQAGQTVTVTVTVVSDAGLAFETDLTIEPGGLTIAVDYPPAG